MRAQACVHPLFDTLRANGEGLIDAGIDYELDGNHHPDQRADKGI